MEVTPYISMMERWAQTAKDCTQLALAMLILPIFFIRDVIGVQPDAGLRAHLNWWFYISWASLGVAIGIGLVYQLTITRLIGDELIGTVTRRLYPNWQFRVMIAAIATGVGCFVMGVIAA